MRQVWCEIRLHDTFVTWTGKRCSVMDILHHFTTSHYVIMHQIKTTYCIHRSLCILLFFPLAPFWPIIEERPSFASWRSREVSLWSIIKQKSKWRAQVKSSLALKPEWTVSFLCCPSKAVWENCEDVWHLQGTQEKSFFWRVAIRPQYSVSICWGAVWGWTHHRTAEMNAWEVQMLICFHLLQIQLTLSFINMTGPKMLQTMRSPYETLNSVAVTRVQCQHLRSSCKVNNLGFLDIYCHRCCCCCLFCFSFSCSCSCGGCGWSCGGAAAGCHVKRFPWCVSIPP